MGDCLGVATVAEGVELVEANINASILLYSLPAPEEIPDVVANDLVPFAITKEFIEQFQHEAKKQNKNLLVHLKIDTGMGRIGCQPEDAVKFAKMITEKPNLKLGGVCTHLSVADAFNRRPTLQQIAILKDCVSKIRDIGIDPGIIHAANSGAIIGSEEAFFDMVRPGIMIYGYYPSSEQERIISLKPPMAFVTKVVFLKKVRKDTPISYGMTYKTKSETIIATLPVGYADGYNRLLSNKGEVFIKGKLYKISGRVCMDQCMVDLGTDSDVNLYDDVVLFGPGSECMDAEKIARLINTIPYEVTCLVSKRVPRIYVE